jgi:hypothetical protein
MVSKDTLFVWDGIIESTPKEKGVYSVVWYGTVTANEYSQDATKVPSPTRNPFKEFCDSDFKFRVTGTAKAVDGSKDENRFKPHRMSLSEGEGWEYDGLKHQDAELDILLENLQWQGSPDPRKQLVFAHGRGAFGPFISVGWMRPGNRITLARRYLDTSDSRASWNNETLRAEVLGKIFDEEEEEIKMPPWKCSVLNA